MASIGAGSLVYVVGHRGHGEPRTGMVAVWGTVANQHTLTRMAGGIRNTSKSVLGRPTGQEVGVNPLCIGPHAVQSTYVRQKPLSRTSTASGKLRVDQNFEMLSISF